MPYLERAVDAQLDRLLPHVGAIAIDGPKAVGKTETAQRRATTTLRLDAPSDVQVIESDPSFASLPAGTILIDEWQKLPSSWDFVRRAVDSGAAAGRFLLTGSATPQSGVDTHSGAGRILSLRMRPLALFERHGAHPTVSITELMQGTATIAGETPWLLKDYAGAIASSGFPGFNEAPEFVINEQLDSYLQRIVDRDLAEQGYIVRNRDGLLRWLAAYAAASSTTTSYSELLDAATPGEGAKPAKSTTLTYREKLSEIWMLDPVPAWDLKRAPFSGLAKAPKHQLADPAFVLRLLGIPSAKLISPQFSYLLGPLFESLATLSVRVALEANFGTVGHLRTLKGNHEVDLIAQSQDGSIVAFEVKLAAHVRDEDVAHLHWLKKQRPDDINDLVIITTGSRAYRRADGVAVIPLALLGA